MDVEGTVVASPKDEGRVARIRVIRSNCVSCASKPNCGLKASDSAAGGIVGLTTSESLEVGDHVTLALPDGEIARAALRAYILPLTCAVALAASAEWLATVAGLADPWRAASGPAACFLGVLIGFAVCGRLSSRIR